MPTPMYKATILVIEDEVRMLQMLRTMLHLGGYRILTASSGPEGLCLALEPGVDLVLLDLGLPGLNGFDVLAQIRHRCDVPVIIVTAWDDEDSKIRGLEMGADDYLTKPFSRRELQARIAAVLRRYGTRPQPRNDQVFSNGWLRVDLGNRRVTVNEHEIHLTPIEYILLTEFVHQPGKVIPHSQLLGTVWGPEYRDEVGILRANIYRLRQKVEPDPAHPQIIRSEPGVGYLMVQI